MFDFKNIEMEDPELASAMLEEINRQNNNIELIASENFVSKAVMAAMGSPLTNKYAEGYPNKRYYGGCEKVDIIEQIAIDRAKKLFDCNYANVQAHSGAQANMAVYFALLKPGDTILGMNLSHGGHLTHGSPVNISGKYFNIVPYGVDKTGFIDFDEVYKQAKEHKPKLIVAGASAYPRSIDFKKFADIAKEVGAYLMVDMAHIAGLVAAGYHMSPIPYADITTSTTHKTLRGPRGGLILSNDEKIAKAIDKAIFPGTQGGPLIHVIAAKAVCFKEALEPSFKIYSKNVIDNAKVLSNALLKNGFEIVSGGTDNHLILVDVSTINMTGKEAEIKLDEIRITCNKNAIPFDTKSPNVTSGIRLGTPAMTTRGLGADDMLEIANIIEIALKDFDKNKVECAKRVQTIVKKHPLNY